MFNLLMTLDRGLLRAAKSEDMSRPKNCSAAIGRDGPNTGQGQVIAQRIIEGARAGARDPIALCKMAVKDLMVP
jgi:hypothetical protein